MRNITKASIGLVICIIFTVLFSKMDMTGIFVEILNAVAVSCVTYIAVYISQEDTRLISKYVTYTSVETVSVAASEIIFILNFRIYLKSPGGRKPQNPRLLFFLNACMTDAFLNA